VRTRIVVGRAAVAAELRAAAPLMATVRAPVTARAPWLTAVLDAEASRRPRARPVAVVVGEVRPDAVAFLTLRRRGVTTAVTLLGDGTAPVPPGSPPFRLPARDEGSADRLAEGIAEVLRSLRGPWSLQLAGLPLGDPTLRALSARLPTGLLANSRSSRMVDDLDAVGTVERSVDPRVLERRLPALLDREPDRRARAFLRAAARLHAAVGQVEVAVVVDGDALRAGLLTLLDGEDRRTWWGTSDIGGLPTELGAPLVRLTVPARDWPPLPGRRARVSAPGSAAR
jgi:hypothetical protein